MNILVTGAAGFTGRRLVPLLARAGHRVLAVVHRDPAMEARASFDHPSISVRRLDLAGKEVATLDKGFDAVIALAQSQSFRDFPDRAEDIFAVNVAGHLQLLDWARRSGVRRFIYASSGGIYGPGARIDVAESDLLAVDSPLGFYLGSKLCAEVIFQNYRHYFETAAILRPFFIYGEGQRPDMLIARLIGAVREGRPIQLQGPDGLKINPIYVDDAAAAFAAALNVTGCKVINVAGPETATLRDIGERIGRLLRRAPVFEQVPGTPSDYVANIDVARSLLGAPRFSLDTGLARATQTKEAK
jgi:nucleoside-diphosphate-sugar epimerase